MKYDLSLFEQLNEEYRSKPIVRSVPQYDPNSQFDAARSRLISLNKLVPLDGKRILEVGCGRGYVSKVLATEYRCSVVGVDITESNEWKLLRDESPNLEYRVLDLGSANPFDRESFDLIVSFVVWEHIIHPFTMLSVCCQLMKPSGAMYLSANLYRAPNSSHRYREVLFPFPHLLFDDDVFSEYYMKNTGKGNRAARLNKLTYSHYKEYFRILNLSIEHEDLRRMPLDKDFYNRFKDKLERYPVFDLELAFFAVLLRKGTPVIEQRHTFLHEPVSQLEAAKNSLSYRLGNLLVEAVVSPGRNTILLPYRLARLGMTGLKKRRSQQRKGGKGRE